MCWGRNAQVLEWSSGIAGEPGLREVQGFFVGGMFSHRSSIRILSHANVSSYSGQAPPVVLMSLLTFPLGLPISLSPRHTLWKRVQKVVTPFLALLIAAMDKNGNLELLARPRAKWVTNLWMFIFSDAKFLSVPPGVGKNR